MLGFLQSIAPAVIGGLFGSSRQSSANDTNVALSREQMEFQRQSQQIAHAYNLEMQDRAHAFSAQSMAQQQEYNREMSNTAHQRAVADLKAAGLNPMLALNRGAETAGAVALPGTAGAGSSAQPGSRAEVRSTGQGWLEGLSTAFQIRSAELQLEKLEAERDLLRSEVPLRKEQTRQVGERGTVDEFTWRRMKMEMEELFPEHVSKVIAETYEAYARGDLSMAQVRSEFYRAGLLLSERNLNVLRQLEGELGIPRRINEEGIQHDWWAREVMPRLPSIVESLFGAGQASRLLNLNRFRGSPGYSRSRSRERSGEVESPPGGGVASGGLYHDTRLFPRR